MSAAHRIARAAGSTAATLALLGLTALVAIAGQIWPIGVADWMAAPGAGLTVNLLAALWTSSKLRVRPLLFAFHAMLVVLAVLIAADRLTMLRGHVEVTEGAMFDPALAVVEAGPLHAWRLDRVAFAQGPFDIRYLPGMKRRETVSTLRVPTGDGGWREAFVGDDHPLVVGDYRFYTTFNKGFAPVVTFVGADGARATGAIHLPSYPLNDYNQGNDWTPPGAAAPLKLWLSLDAPLYDAGGRWRFRIPENPELVVIEGDRRRPLRLGDSVEVAAGVVRFDAVRSWMGYTIAANPFAPWMMAAALIACALLAAHLILARDPRVAAPPRGPLQSQTRTQTHEADHAA